MLKVGETYKITGVNICELKRGERLKKKNGKKLIPGKGSKKIKVTLNSDFDVDTDWSNDA